MTRQEKFIALGLLTALLLGAAVYRFRHRGAVGHDLPHLSLKTGAR